MPLGFIIWIKDPQCRIIVHKRIMACDSLLIVGDAHLHKRCFITREFQSQKALQKRGPWASFSKALLSNPPWDNCNSIPISD